MADDLKISALPSAPAFLSAMLVPVVDLTQAVGTRTQAMAAATLAPVRSVAGRVGNVVVTTTDLANFTTAVNALIAASNTGAPMYVGFDLSGLIPAATGSATPPIYGIDIPLPVAGTITTNFSGSHFTVGVAASGTVTIPYSITSGGTKSSIGSQTIVGTTVTSAITQTVNAAGDLLTVGFPSTQDATLANFAGVIKVVKT